MPTDNWYIDSSVGAGGDGTIGNPFNALATLNWTTVQNEINAGDTVNINLKRGSVFRETLTPAANGAAGRPIMVQDYSTGALPIINGSDALLQTNWSSYGAGLGNTWQIAITTSCLGVWYNNLYMWKGGSATTLNNKEWFWAANVLYFRLDGASAPADNTVEASKRTNCIYENNHHHITFKNLVLTKDNSYTYAEANTVTDVTIDSCQFVDTQSAMDLRGTVLNVQYCLFNKSWVQNRAVYFGNAAGATGTFKYCIFHRGWGKALQFQAGSTLTLDNCTFVGFYDAPLYVSTGTVTARNNVISGSVMTGAAAGLVFNSATLNLTNSMVTRKSLAKWVDGATPGAGTVYDTRPGWKNNGRIGFYCIVNDDIDTTASIQNYTHNEGQVFRDTGVTGIPGKTVGVTGSLLNTYAYDATDWSNLSSIVAGGDDLALHGRHNPWWDIVNTFKIQYTGAGSPASLSVSGGHLTTTCTGAPGDNVDFTLASYTTTALRAALTATGKYTISSADATLDAVPSAVLADQTSADIKTAAVQIVQDPTRYWDAEITAQKTEIEANVAGFTVRAAVYPGGNNTPALRAYLAAHGYKGATLADYSETFKGYAAENLSLYGVDRGASPGYLGLVQRLLLTNDLTDNSGLAHTFTKGGAGTIHYAAFGRDIQGTGLDLRNGDFYIYHAADAHWDFTWADWNLGVYIKPTSMTGTQTIYYQGTDANNYMNLYLDANGAGHFKIVSGGTAVVDLATANSTFVTNTAASITVRQMAGKIELMYGAGFYANTVSASATTGLIPAAYTGNIQWFAGYNWGGSAAENYFSGYADEPFVATYTMSNTIEWLDVCTSQGAVMVQMCHSDTPMDVWKVVADTIKAYQSGTVYVATFADAMEYIRGAADANVTSDGLTARWNQTDAFDFSLNAASKLIDAGADLSYTRDYINTAVPQGTYPDIGAYEYLAAGVDAFASQTGGLSGGANLSQFNPRVRPLRMRRPGMGMKYR